MLKRTRPLFPRPKFYSKCSNAEGVSLKYTGFILQHIVWQREEEDLEHEKRESEIRRQSELPTDLTRKSRRVIPVDPIISPFDSGEDKDLVLRDTPQPSPVSTPRGTPIPSPKHSPSRSLQTQTHTESPETPSSPLTPKCQILHQKSVSSQDSVDSDSDSTMMISTKELVDGLTKTLKNINQSPTIPLPVFRGKKGEDPEDHILKVEDYLRFIK